MPDLKQIIEAQGIAGKVALSMIRQQLRGITIKFYPERGSVVIYKGDDTYSVSFEDIEKLINETN